MSLATLLRAAIKRPQGSGAGDTACVSRYALERIPSEQLARYNTHLGFAADALPITFYYPLAQRAHLATMLEHDFPFRLMGLIHTENDIVEHARPALATPLVLTTHVTLEPPTANGALYCSLRTVAEQDGRQTFECTSRYLAKRGQRGGAKPLSAAQPDRAAATTLAAWTTGPASGRQYASVSGDWNPIHLSGWSARLLGLRAPIIHGAHSLGKACAGLEQATGQRLTRITARFLAPIPLGSEATLAADLPAHVWTLSTGGRIAVAGTYE